MPTTRRARIRWAIQVRDVLLLLGLTGAVAALTVVVFLVQLARVTLDAAQGEAELLIQQVFAMAREVLARPSAEPPARVLAGAPELRALLDAQVGYSRHVVYAAITTPSGEVIVANEGAAEGLAAGEPSRLQDLVSGDPVDRIRGLWAVDLYEVRKPLELDREPFGTVRLGVATALLRAEVEEALLQGAKVGGVALVLALLGGLVLGGSTVRPIRRRRRRLEQMREGELELGPSVGFRGEFEDLAADLDAFGRQVRADRLRLLAERSSLEQLVAHLEDPVLLLNARREVVFANRACEDLLGRPSGDTLGCPLHEVIPPAHPLADLVDRAAAAGEPVRNVRLEIEQADGVGDFLGSAFPVSDEEAAEAGFVVLLEDLEAVQIVRALVRYGARMTSLKRLASGMIHELKNPLNSLALHVELLAQNPPPETVERSLGVLGREIRRLDRLIEDFRRFSRPEELRLEPVEVRTLLSDLADQVRPETEAAGVELELRLAEEPLEIDGDPERLRQALLNVVRNAQQAMPEGGTISLESGFEPPLFARIAVTDTGTGMDADELEKVFQLYYTTKEDGSGVGLFMVHRIVQEHGGMVSATSEPGRGSRIVLHLPVRGTLDLSAAETEGGEAP